MNRGQSTDIQIFIDGSYDPRSGKGGAGIYFEKDSIYNRSLPVPVTCVGPNALRAELYAALVALHIINHEMLLPLSALNITLKQDSQVAIHLLRMTMTLDLCPSRWIREKEAGQSYLHEFAWGQIITRQTVDQCSDILDWWWAYSRGVAIHFHWTKGHELDDGPEAKKQATHDQLGNYWADLYAKGGLDAPEDKFIKECYPLYRRTKLILK